MNRRITNSYNSLYVTQVGLWVGKKIKFATANFFLEAGRQAWGRRAKSIAKYFVLCFHSCGASSLRVENEPYFSTDKELRGETELTTKHKEVAKRIWEEQKNNCEPFIFFKGDNRWKELINSFESH